jgi:hypothetical protein
MKTEDLEYEETKAWQAFLAAEREERELREQAESRRSVAPSFRRKGNRTSNRHKKLE